MSQFGATFKCGYFTASIVGFSLLASSSVASGVTVLNDDFTDGLSNDLTNTTDVPWFTDNTASGSFGTVSPTSGGFNPSRPALQMRYPGTAAVGTFYNAGGDVPASVTLGVGDYIRLRTNFLLDEDPILNGSFSIGLYNSPSLTFTTANGGSSFNDDSGYRANLGTGTTSLAELAYEGGTNSGILAGTDNATLTGVSVAPALNQRRVSYLAELLITRSTATSNTVALTISNAAGTTVLGTASAIDASATQFTFNEVVFGINTGDRRQFDNVLVETSVTPVPEPGSFVFLAAAAAGLTLRRRKAIAR
ncbi:MAG TPA: PEP-CTERM sorting domain-containing protein [Tepidisphaeraceae bacterium]|nr:PEP-CTERM sorting domain-containing protein [Tepidisphaeraceae bacterium]